jgi:hypothetical protein
MIGGTMSMLIMIEDLGVEALRTPAAGDGAENDDQPNHTKTMQLKL